MEKSVDNKKCFVITPIGPVGSSIRRKVDGLIDEVIIPVMEAEQYDVEVSHRINDSGTMTSAIIERVYNSDLVLANRTGNNPNVMYEVALRHASAKPIIHITENVSELPFDINDQRTIEYTDDMSGALDLKDKLRIMVRNIDYTILASNPVTDALTKKNLVNIPQEKSVEITDMLMDMKNDIINSLKREITNREAIVKTVETVKIGETAKITRNGGIASQIYPGLNNSDRALITGTIKTIKQSDDNSI